MIYILGRANSSVADDRPLAFPRRQLDEPEYTPSPPAANRVSGGPRASADASAHTHVAHSVMNVRPTDNGDPDFIPVRGLAAEQMSAAIDIFRVEHLVLIWYSAHHRSSADAGRHLALGHDAIMGSHGTRSKRSRKSSGKKRAPQSRVFATPSDRRIHSPGFRA